MRLTADTITDDQIRELRAGTWGDDDAYVHDLCTAALGGFVMDTRAKIRIARARCAELLNTQAQRRCPGRKHLDHVHAVCEGQCCTSCGGPIDKNEECRC